MTEEDKSIIKNKGEKIYFCSRFGDCHLKSKQSYLMEETAKFQCYECIGFTLPCGYRYLGVIKEVLETYTAEKISLDITVAITDKDAILIDIQKWILNNNIPIEKVRIMTWTVEQPKW